MEEFKNITASPFDATIAGPQSNFTKLNNSYRKCQIFEPQTGNAKAFKVLTFVSFDYMALYLNWLVYYFQICETIENLHTVCTDSESLIFLSNRNISCQKLFVDSKPKLWFERVKLVTDFLQKGTDIILTDVDALWNKNPFVFLKENASIIGSRGTFPEDISRIWGTTFVMGWIYFRSTTTSHLLMAVANLGFSTKMKDDQFAVNHALMAGFDLKLGDQKLKLAGSTQTEIIQLERKMSLCEISPMCKETANDFPAVGFLPFELFRRECKNVPKDVLLESVVLHCLSKKKGEQAMQNIKELGLWKIKDMWKDSQTGISVEQYIQQILL